MKRNNLIIFLMMIASLFTKVSAQTQMKYWVLPPNKLDFTGSSASLSSLPGSPSSSQYTLSNGAYDENGNLPILYQKYGCV